MEVPIEHHIVPITEDDITTQEVDKIERFSDETERLFNRGKSMERLILHKCKELNIQHVIMASMVDNVAADALTSLCLGLGKNLRNALILSFFI